MSVNHWHVRLDVDVDTHLRRNRRTCRIADELADVDFCAWALGKPAELREASRERLETLGFGLQHVDRLGQIGRRVAAQSRDGEANRRQRILELVRNLSRALTKRRGPLGFEGAR